MPQLIQEAATAEKPRKQGHLQRLREHDSGSTALPNKVNTVIDWGYWKYRRSTVDGESRRGKLVECGVRAHSIDNTLALSLALSGSFTSSADSGNPSTFLKISTFSPFHSQKLQTSAILFFKTTIFLPFHSQNLGWVVNHLQTSPNFSLKITT